MGLLNALKNQDIVKITKSNDLVAESERKGSSLDNHDPDSN